MHQLSAFVHQYGACVAGMPGCRRSNLLIDLVLAVWHGLCTHGGHGEPPKASARPGRTPAVWKTGASPHIAPRTPDDGGFAAGLGARWNESRSHDYDSSEAPASPCENPSGPEQEAGGTNRTLAENSLKPMQAFVMQKITTPPASALVQYAG